MASVPAPGTVLTGDSVSPLMTRYLLIAPSDLWIQELIYGMIWDLTQSFRFTQGGAVTPDQAAEVFTNIWESLTVTTQIGTIIMYAGIALPPDTLPCDGGSYLRADYPQLFAILGVLWGSVDSDHFNVPDLRGRTGIASGSGPGLTPRTITDAGGEETHKLTVAEMPSHAHTDTGHSHAYSAAFTTVINGGLEAPASAAIAVADVTGAASANIQSTGGDGSHNNMQPYTVVNFGIIAR